MASFGMRRVHLHGRGDAGRSASRGAAEAFWPAALGAIAAYAFLIALGAFDPGDVLVVSLAVAALAAMWIGHAWAEGHRGGSRDEP